MKRRVAVTGMGAISPIGNTINEIWANIKAGKCGIGEISLYDTSDQKVKIAAEAKVDFADYIDKKKLRTLDRSNQFALAASKVAIEDSGLDLEKEDRSNIAVYISSGIGGLGTMEKEIKSGMQRGMDRISPFFIPMSIANLSASHVAMEYGFHGSVMCHVTACAGSNTSIGEAFRQIRDGYFDLALAGGAEASVTSAGIGGFTSMRALSDSNDPARASIPFDADRSGFVLGEGGAVLVLEEWERAHARGAKIYGEIVGYGATCDAAHVTAPDENGTWAAKAMKDAIADAGIELEQIDYINAHGTSTPLNDKIETKAIKLAFGEHAYKLKVSSTKSMTGHLLGAAGAMEAIISLLAMQSSYIPATIGYKNPDPDCDLDIVPNTGIEQQVNYVLSNSLGFGGHNVMLCFKRYGKDENGV
ncbi:MAG: beta-ketoacyl-ACP synthase II [Clostridiales bacterium]|nr:beta-ketoacyl-ACP synthase II [Clostridiales bacterium]